MLSADAVFLIDVDNTLLDNDRFAVVLSERLEESFGTAQRKRYWDILEDRRSKFGFADYLGTLEAFRSGLEEEPLLFEMSSFLLEYQFSDLLFPQALAAIRHLRAFGRPVVLSDGDIVFQPRKIQHAGIWDAVEGDVLVYLHKEQSLDHVERRYPASHYVVFDDKPNLLAAMKSKLGERLTTVFVRQGHFALAPGSNAIKPPPDRTIEHIGDILSLNSSDFEVRS